jgi:hypothetical protein
LSFRLILQLAILCFLPFSNILSHVRGQHIKSRPNPTSGRYILILSSHLRLGIPSGPLPSGFSTDNPVWTCPLPYASYMPCPSVIMQISHPFLFIISSTSNFYISFTRQNAKVSTRQVCRVDILYTLHYCVPFLSAAFWNSCQRPNT